MALMTGFSPASTGEANRTRADVKSKVRILEEYMMDTKTQNLQIREASYKDVLMLWDMAISMKLEKDTDYFERLFEHQRLDGRLILIAERDGFGLGYCILNWEPKYAFFKKFEIPEIQDLNVLPEHRRQAIASAMIKYCEDLAVLKKCETMGISVALTASYGPAQKLYVKLGYVPDGNGVTYDRKPVGNGEFKPVDDQLCLMMVKNLVF